MPLAATVPQGRPQICTFPSFQLLSLGSYHAHAAYRFTINLQNGMYDGSDVAMHFDVRFRYGDSVNTVVRNHCQGGGWGQEERGVSYFPFMPSANFDIIILCEPQAFKVRCR